MPTNIRDAIANVIYKHTENDWRHGRKQITFGSMQLQYFFKKKLHKFIKAARR